MIRDLHFYKCSPLRDTHTYPYSDHLGLESDVYSAATRGVGMAISFYSPSISSAERLPNGNTLICEGAPERIFEVTPNKEIVWEYISPFFVAGATAAGRGPRGKSNSLFRAHRCGPDHPALQGRDLDPARNANLNRLYGRT